MQKFRIRGVNRGKRRRRRVKRLKRFVFEKIDKQISKREYANLDRIGRWWRHERRFHLSALSKVIKSRSRKIVLIYKKYAS